MTDLKLKIWYRALRITQWKKQVLICLPIIALGESITIEDIARLIWVSLAFSFLASTIYLYNDIQDLHLDMFDNYKKHRPLASGEVSASEAKVVGTFLFFLSLTIVFLSSGEISRASVLTLMSIYFVSNIFYSKFNLKNHRIIGLVIVASGFSIRFAIGTLLLNLEFSVWALVLIAQLSLFMLSGKRFQNVLRKREDSLSENIDSELQFWLLSMVTFAAFFAATYSGFMSDPSVIAIWGKYALVISTLPLGVGLVRYVEIVTHPKKFLLSDATENMTRDLLIISLVILYTFIMFVGRVTV